MYYVVCCECVVWCVVYHVFVQQLEIESYMRTTKTLVLRMGASVCTVRAIQLTWAETRMTWMLSMLQNSSSVLG